MTLPSVDSFEREIRCAQRLLLYSLATALLKLESLCLKQTELTELM